MAKRGTAPFLTSLQKILQAHYLLILIVLLGGMFRFYDPAWDYQQSFHPDERNILNAVDQALHNKGYRVDFFAYGQLTPYLYLATGKLLTPPAFMWSLSKENRTWPSVVYWMFLAALFWAIFWFFSREKNKIPAFYAASGIVTGILILKFLNVFNLWFNALGDIPLKISSIALTALASLGLSGLFAFFFKTKWTGKPLLSACGAIFIFGVLPFALPKEFCALIAALSFTLILITGFNWFAWVSRWGRVLAAALSAWVLLASLRHSYPNFLEGGDFIVIGRVWSAAFSTATIAALYMLVQRLYQNRTMALLAAATLSFSVVCIEQAHYYITESFISLMFVVVVILSHGIYKTANWRNYLFAGAAFGLALAAKTSALYYVLILVLGHLLFLSKTTEKSWLAEGRKLRKYDGLYSILAGLLLVLTVSVFIGVGFNFKGVLRDLFNSDKATGFRIWLVLFGFLTALGSILGAWGLSKFKVLKAQMPYWIKLASSGGLAFLFFFLFSPWSLLDFKHFMDRQNYEWQVVSIADACYVLQFKDTLRYLYQLENLVTVNLGWPLGVTVILGMVWVLGRFLWRLFRPVTKGGVLPVPFFPNRGFAFSPSDLLILIWFLAYFGFIGAWNTKFVRYMVPLIPAFCIFGAILLTDFFRWTKNRPGFLKPLLIGLIIVPSLLYSMAYMRVYRNQHPWYEASYWMYKNIPLGATIVNEVWGDGLPKPMSSREDSRMEKPMWPESFKNLDISPYEMFGQSNDNSPQKKNSYAEIVQKGDVISISTKKLWYTLTDCTAEFRPHGFNVYPVTSRYYRLLWSGQLGFKMAAEFKNFPGLFGWEHPDDMAEETFSWYDHPRVYIFRKTEEVPTERILKMLETDDYVKGISRDDMLKVTPENQEAFIAERRRYLAEKGLQ